MEKPINGVAGGTKYPRGSVHWQRALNERIHTAADDFSNCLCRNRNAPASSAQPAIHRAAMDSRRSPLFLHRRGPDNPGLELFLKNCSGRKAPSPFETTEQYIRGWTIGRMNRPSFNRMESCHEV
jgi:hypothetical protein